MIGTLCIFAAPRRGSDGIQSVLTTAYPLYSVGIGSVGGNYGRIAEES